MKTLMPPADPRFAYLVDGTPEWPTPKGVSEEPCDEFSQADGDHERRKEICRCGWPLSRHDTPAPWEGR